MPSIDFGLNEIFSYEHYTIPSLGSRRVRKFKVVEREGHSSQSDKLWIELKQTDSLSNVTATLGEKSSEKLQWIRGSGFMFG
jgi:hypothetical protein